MLVKRAVDETRFFKNYEPALDPRNLMHGKELEAYNAYKPINVGRYDFGTGNIKVTHDPGLAYNDINARRVKYKHPGFVNVFMKDDAGNLTAALDANNKPMQAWYRTEYSTQPGWSIRNGDPANKMYGGYLYDRLKNKGYGGHELKGMSDATTLFGVRGNPANAPDLPDKPSTTIYVDKAGNIVDRSRGIVIGRRAGRIVGGGTMGLGGYMAGNAIANSLGWNDPDATKAQRFGSNILSYGGGAGGMYLGGKYGNLLGEYIGGKIDPQKGTPIKMYSPKYPKPLNLLRIK